MIINTNSGLLDRAKGFLFLLEDMELMLRLFIPNFCATLPSASDRIGSQRLSERSSSDSIAAMGMLLICLIVHDAKQRLGVSSTAMAMCVLIQNLYACGI